MPEAKAAMRRSVLVVLRAIDPETRARLSAALVSRARSERVWRDAEHVLAYHPMKEEVDLVPLLQDAVSAHGRVWMPRMQDGELSFHAVRSLRDDTTAGQFGILEPGPQLPRFDPSAARGAILVITPGLAFDRAGRRLGRGRGYYDRFLRSLRAEAAGRVCSLALAFASQILDRVPSDERDELVDIVVTGRETIPVTGGQSPGA